MLLSSIDAIKNIFLSKFDKSLLSQNEGFKIGIRTIPPTVKKGEK